MKTQKRAGESRAVGLARGVLSEKSEWHYVPAPTVGTQDRWHGKFTGEPFPRIRLEPCRHQLGGIINRLQPPRLLRESAHNEQVRPSDHQGEGVNQLN